MKNNLPKFAENQLNGRTASENYKAIVSNRQEYYRRKAQIDKELEKYKAVRKAQLEAELAEEIQAEVLPKTEKALDSLFADLL